MNFSASFSGLKREWSSIPFTETVGSPDREANFSIIEYEHPNPSLL
jgi:hypothetical protein